MILVVAAVVAAAAVVVLMTGGRNVPAPGRVTAPGRFPPTLAVGAPGPAVSCSARLRPGADVARALRSASPGDVVCLQAGPWGPLTLGDIAPAGPVTLAAAPGTPVHLGGLVIAGQADAPSDTRNLTIRGFWIDRGVQDLTDSTGGLVFRYNTIAGIRQGYGFYFNANGNGGTHSQTGVTVRDNRIERVGECLGVAGGGAHDLTFEHNVCGPGIGYGDTASTQPGHYIEIGGINGLSVDGNVFLGPADPGASRAGLHLNVLHIFGGARDVSFSGNVLWHTQAVGQAILLQEGQFDRIRINGNLDVEDPTCGSGHGACSNYMIESADAHGLTFEHNTVVGAYWGVLLTSSDEPGDYPTGTDYTIRHNIVVGSRGGADLSYGGCVVRCAFDHNVTDDGSARRGGAGHGVAGWQPRWTDATRHLPAGLPFPAGYTPPSY